MLKLEFPAQSPKNEIVTEILPHPGRGAFGGTMSTGKPNGGRPALENQSHYLFAAFALSALPFLLAFLREGLGLSFPFPGPLAKSATFQLLASDGLVDILMDWNTGCRR